MATCSDCGQDHGHQRIDYPVGAVVKALHEMTGPTYAIQAGTQGRVVGHCDDGRAIIDFGGIGSHTFHIPDGYIEIDELAALRAELARVTAERDELRVALDVVVSRAFANLLYDVLSDDALLHVQLAKAEIELMRQILDSVKENEPAALSSTSTPAAPPETAAKSGVE